MRGSATSTHASTHVPSMLSLNLKLVGRSTRASRLRWALLLGSVRWACSAQRCGALCTHTGESAGICVAACADEPETPLFKWLRLRCCENPPKHYNSNGQQMLGTVDNGLNAVATSLCVCAPMCGPCFCVPPFLQAVRVPGV